MHVYISPQKPEPSESFLYLQTTSMKSAFSPVKPCSQYSLCVISSAPLYSLSSLVVTASISNRFSKRILVMPQHGHLVFQTPLAGQHGSMKWRMSKCMGDCEAKLLSHSRVATGFGWLWFCWDDRRRRHFPPYKTGSHVKCGERRHVLRSGLWRWVDAIC